MLKIVDEENLSEVCCSFAEDENKYYLSTPFDEWIEVDKKTRLIWQCGYNGLIYDWMEQGILEETSLK